MLSSLLPHQKRNSDGFIGSVTNAICFSTAYNNYDITISTSPGWDGIVYYSTNGTSWHVWDGSAVTGKKLYFCGTGNSKITGDEANKWVITCNTSVRCDGDIESLRSYTGTAPTMAANCYAYMFSENTCLTTSPQLSATSIAAYCYMNMFSGCTGLTTPPRLPATTLADSCYSMMFFGCTGLTSPQELPATTLADSCYMGMFFMTTFTTPPALPATTLANLCYSNMFSYSGITVPPKLPATTLASSCYSGMFYSCSALSAFPKLPATTLVSSCYYEMFYECPLLNISDTQGTDYPTALYYFPSTDQFSCKSMFYHCSGDSLLTMSGTPTANTWYYTNNTVIE